MSKKILIPIIIGISTLIIISIYFLGFNVENVLSQIVKIASDEISKITFNRELFWMVIGSFVTIFVAFIFYKVSGRAFEGIITRAGGNEGDVKMLLGLWRIIVAFVCILAILGTFFELSLFLAALGAFGGLFLGWALQPLVSGFAAWLLITIKRPFRVGDRVQLPSFSLVGDVQNVGPMYTILNQVGGAVGSEEPVGRHILVPNAMLFGNLVINYTPRIGEEEPSPILDKTRESSYILDEVITRITFDSNWNIAENILLDAAREVTTDIIKNVKREPYIRSSMYDYGVYLRLRYMTLATDRPRIKYELEKIIFQEFQKCNDVDFAIPYVYSAKKGSRDETLPN
jgi:small-conductance mechanosensitive channel